MDIFQSHLCPMLLQSDGHFNFFLNRLVGATCQYIIVTAKQTYPHTFIHWMPSCHLEYNVLCTPEYDANKPGHLNNLENSVLIVMETSPILDIWTTWETYSPRDWKSNLQDSIGILRNCWHSWPWLLQSSLESMKLLWNGWSRMLYQMSWTYIINGMCWLLYHFDH